MNYGAYMTETFRAGIQSIGKGQREAAAALGMTYWQTMRLIILPQAARVVIPPVGNEFIAMTKDSALVSVIGVQELLWRSQKVGQQYFHSMETLLIAAVFYWMHDDRAAGHSGAPGEPVWPAATGRILAFFALAGIACLMQLHASFGAATFFHLLLMRRRMICSLIVWLRII